MTNKEKLIKTDPEVINFWDYQKNKITPNDITRKSTFTAWWKCKLGHSFESKICNMTRKLEACPICSGKLIVAGINDALFLFPRLKENLVSDISILQTIGKGSHKPITWYCEKEGSTYTRVVRNQIIGNYKCPRCSKSEAGRKPRDRNTTYIKRSILEKEVEMFILSILDNMELKSNVWIKKHENYNPFEIDLLIPDLKIGIEVNGDYWHSNKAAIKLGFKSSKERHERKRSILKNLGYELFFIWEYDWTNKNEECKEALVKLFKKESVKSILTKTKGSNPKFP